MKDQNNLEIVEGDGSTLEISPAYDNISNSKPKSAKQKPTNIVVPKTKKTEKK